MCGIAGILALDRSASQVSERELGIMAALIRHRGPDGRGIWMDQSSRNGLAHTRLSIIDLSSAASQPMVGQDGRVIVFNGELYNYIELRESLADRWNFRTSSDTEVLLASYDRWGEDCVNHFRGMFSFLIFDPKTGTAFGARDRFGVKPFYYMRSNGRFYFASEIKALLPFADEVKTDFRGLQQYLTFQFTMDSVTLFDGIMSLPPGHALTIKNGDVSVGKYWDLVFEADFDHTPRYFHTRVRELFEDSVRLHLRSDVPVGSYLSGGLDSSLIAILASRHDAENNAAFHGKFTEFPGYDESKHASLVATAAGKTLHQIDITADDFINHIAEVIYHLDQPTAGPGSFPQYMVSQMAAQQVKVVLGGQGGDEIFAGYARYLIAYFEQCLKAAIDDTYRDGNFVVTAETIIPNLRSLQEYKPLIKFFWEGGLFESHDARYFRLINRFADLQDEIATEALCPEIAWQDFEKIFNNTSNVHNRAYLDQMLHFDLKTLLPALLHVEDRMSMAHGLESRVPFLDHPLVEFVARVPATVKFRHGEMKYLIKEVFKDLLPQEIVTRRDKMGFPVPLNEWYSGALSGFIQDIFSSQATRQRGIFRQDAVMHSIQHSRRFSRKTWGLLSLELWFQTFADRGQEFRSLLKVDELELDNAVAKLAA